MSVTRARARVLTKNFIQAKNSPFNELTGLLTDFGVNLGAQYLYDKIKNLPAISTRWGEIRVVFQLIAKLYDPIPYDMGNTELLRILKNYEIRDSQLNINDGAYSYHIDWEFSDDDIHQGDSWLQDTYIVDDNGERKPIIYEQEIAANRVMGFRVIIFSLNTGIELQNILVVGFDALDALNINFIRNSRLRIKTALKTTSVMSSKDTNKQLYNKITRKINNAKLLNNINLQETTKEFSQLIIYSKDKFDIVQIADAIKTRWPF